jgi:predicted GNAT family acetyltransferase
MNAAAAPNVQHDATNHCFFLILDDQRCVLDYTLQGQIMTITHTGVPDALGGRGLAAPPVQQLGGEHTSRGA